MSPPSRQLRGSPQRCLSATEQDSSWRYNFCTLSRCNGNDLCADRNAHLHEIQIRTSCSSGLRTLLTLWCLSQIASSTNFLRAAFLDVSLHRALNLVSTFRSRHILQRLTNLSGVNREELTVLVGACVVELAMKRCFNIGGIAHHVRELAAKRFWHSRTIELSKPLSISAAFSHPDLHQARHRGVREDVDDSLHRYAPFRANGPPANTGSSSASHRAR